MDPDVARLVREERLLDAARLASSRGDAALASRLYERACEWQSAATEALREGDGARALELALQGGDDVAAEAAVALAARDPAAQALSGRLERRGHHAWAARLLEACGRDREAARAWERVGEATRAADLLERSGDPAAAARVLGAAAQRDALAWGTALAFGSLLVRFGKNEAAVRVLQKVPRGAAERPGALARLIPALDRLGLSHASREASGELAALGGSAGTSGRAPALPEQNPPARRLFGRYDVVREIASSPNARVFDCFDSVRGERVALKLFSVGDARGVGGDALVQFEREARTVGAVDHPNVVPLRDFVPQGPALALAWMAGGTLEAMLADTPVLSPARAAEIAMGLLSGLGVAHRLGVLHRDAKPSSVFFDEAGGARLGNFGVVHLSDISRTATASDFGSLAYSSPEQREGRPASAGSDVFAVGVILREMLTGRRTADSPPLRPSDVQRALDARHDGLVDRMTARDPAERIADAFEARDTLAALSWPKAVGALALATGSPSKSVARRPEGPEGTSSASAGRRLQVASGGRMIDTWTDRPIEQVHLTERVLARARAFALADHPGLQRVLRVAHEESTLWLEFARGEPLNRALSPEERALLAGAIDALHAAGAAHGCIDCAHVIVSEAGVVLRFDGGDSPATPERDRQSFERL
jgi:hypothetical protein